MKISSPSMIGWKVLIARHLRPNRGWWNRTNSEFGLKLWLTLCAREAAGPWRGSGPCCPSPGRSCSRLPLQASRRSRDKNWWSCRPELLVHLLHLRTNIREGFKNSSSIDYWNCPLSGRVGYRWSTKENDMTNDIRKVGGVEVSQWTFSY